MSNPKISDAAKIAKQCDKDVVIILHIDKEHFGYASYGASKKLCERARQFADVAIEAVMKAEKRRKE